jgi:hypothetical protein
MDLETSNDLPSNSENTTVRQLHQDMMEDEKETKKRGIDGCRVRLLTTTLNLCCAYQIFTAAIINSGL